MSGLEVFGAVVAVGQVADFLRKILRAVEEIKHVDSTAKELMEKSQGYYNVLQAVEPITKMLGVRAEQSKTSPGLQDETEKASAQIIVRSILKFRTLLHEFAEFLKLVDSHSDAVTFVQKRRLKRVLDRRDGQDLMSAIDFNINQLLMGVSFYRLSESVTRSQSSVRNEVQSTMHIHLGQPYPSSFPETLGDAFAKYLTDDSTESNDLAAQDPADSVGGGEEEDSEVPSVIGRLLEEEQEENISDLRSLRKVTGRAPNENLEYDDRTPLPPLARLIEKYKEEAHSLEAYERLEMAEQCLVEAIALSNDFQAYGNRARDLDLLWDDLSRVLGEQGKVDEQRDAIDNRHVAFSQPRRKITDLEQRTLLPRGPATPEASPKVLRMAKTYINAHHRRPNSDGSKLDLEVAERLLNYSFKGFLQIGHGDVDFLETVRLLIQTHTASGKILYAQVYCELYPQALRERRGTTSSTAGPASPVMLTHDRTASVSFAPPQAILEDARLSPVTTSTSNADGLPGRAMSLASVASDDGSGATLEENYKKFLDAYVHNDEWHELSVALKSRTSKYWNYVLVKAVERRLVGIVDNILDMEWAGLYISPNVCDGPGRPILHIAAINGDADMLNKIIYHNADVTKADTTGWTALHCVAARGRNDLASIILKSLKGDDIDAKDSAGNTALHEAVKRRLPDMVKLLLDSRANDQVRNGNRRTPLEEAIHNDDLEIAQLWKGRASITSVDWTRYADKQKYYMPYLRPAAPVPPSPPAQLDKSKRRWFGKGKR